MKFIFSATEKRFYTRIVHEANHWAVGRCYSQRIKYNKYNIQPQSVLVELDLSKLYSCMWVRMMVIASKSVSVQKKGVYTVDIKIKKQVYEAVAIYIAQERNL